MSLALIYKLLVFMVLIAVLISLASGMTFLIKDKGKGERTLNSLKLRVSLSVLLFLLLIIGIKAGWLRPHGIYGEPVNIQTPR